MNDFYKKALEVLDQIDKSIDQTAEKNRRQGVGDQRFRQSITVCHGDGSFFHFTNASCAKDSQFLYIWTEHTGNHLFYLEDLENFKSAVCHPIENIKKLSRSGIPLNE